MPKCPFCKLHTDTGTQLQEHIDHKHPEEATDVTGPRRRQRKKFVAKKKEYIVVDGDEIASIEGDPAVVLLKRYRSLLVKDGFNPIILVSKHLREEVDDEHEYNRIINLKWIREVDDVSESIIAVSKKRNCSILSNKNYSKQAKSHEDANWKLNKHIRTYKIKDGNLVF